MGDENKRRLKRHSLIRFVWFKVIPREAEETSAERIAHSCDISMGGIGVVVTDPYELDTLLFVEIATGDFTLSAVGKVAHVRQVENDRHHMGIEFIVLPPNDRKLLRRLCKDSQGDR